ncbi:hypothetical protein EVAR_4991_1 [Eumeta japonica]|uniref:Uncharacterized protein n=1 Tax=Eumeta variegata TaxID=151549 RepID=A0A4C1V0K6_EUMVA|nr:hypothetical protein EVAR_4991_1 [Eumeta japonica]
MRKKKVFFIECRGVNEQASHQRVDGHRRPWTLATLEESLVRRWPVDGRWNQDSHQEQYRDRKREETAVRQWYQNGVSESVSAARLIERIHSYPRRRWYCTEGTAGMDLSRGYWNYVERVHLIIPELVYDGRHKGACYVSASEQVYYHSSAAARERVNEQPAVDKKRLPLIWN